MARTGNNARIPIIGTYANTGGATFAEDLTELADNTASLIGEAVSTVGALPTEDNWPGREVYVISLDRMYTWTGTAWSPQKGMYREAVGLTASVTIPAGGETSVTLTFPTNRFTVIPIVVAGLVDAVRDVNVYVESVTLTQFVLNRGSTSVVTRSARASWHAFQATPTTAAG